MYDYVAIIQARMSSSRLPGKTLMDICGKPLLQHVVERLSKSRRLNEIIVAIPDNDGEQPVVALCRSLGVQFWQGDENDVLGRVYHAAHKANARNVVRITADCPMIDPCVVDGCIELFEALNVDYASNVNVRTFPDGLDTEVMTMAALREAFECATLPKLREHVTPYIRGIFSDLPSGEFTRADFVFSADFGHVRWTVDWQEDLERVRTFFQELGAEFSWLEALSLATKRPDLLGLRSQA